MIDLRTSSLAAFVAVAAVTLGAIAPATPALAQRSLLDDDDDDDDDDSPCMTSNRMRQFLAGKGYSDIKLNSPIGSTWQASANKGSSSYLVWVETCSATIVRTANRGSR